MYDAERINAATAVLSAGAHFLLWHVIDLGACADKAMASMMAQPRGYPPHNNQDTGTAILGWPLPKKFKLA